MKERLTGAIILVALIVLLVPELLRGPRRPVSAPQVSPAAEEPPLRSYTIDLADDSRAARETPAGAEVPRPSGPVQEQPAVTATASPPELPAASPRKADSESSPSSPVTAPSAATSPVAPQSTGVSSPDSNSRHAPIAAAAQAAAGRGWMVQLGSFASRVNAERLAQQLRGKGFHIAVSESSGGGHKLYRVRVGPTTDRTSAEQLAAKLRAAGHAGSIVPR